MTPRELEALDYVREMIAKAGITPTVREVANRLGMHVGGAARLIDSLVEQGALLKDAKRTRGLRLVGVPDLRSVPTDAIAAELARRGKTLASLEPRARIANGYEQTCAADTCGNAVQRGHLMCRSHWFALPLELRNRVLQTNARARLSPTADNRDAYQRAVTDARDLIDSGSWRARA